MIDLVELAPLVKTFEGLAKAAELNGKPHRASQWKQAVEIIGNLPTMRFTSKELNDKENNIGIQRTIKNS